jgi:imidazolonepropionase
MDKILINIKSIFPIKPGVNGPRSGKEMQELESIENGFISIHDGKIIGIGSMEDINLNELPATTEVIDARGQFALPCFVDSHTHVVFAEPRHTEFVDRIKGLTYEEIALRGGGILNSAKKLQESSEDKLYLDAMIRLEELMQLGTGAIEIKSGYGLTVEAELKMLRVIKRLKENSPMVIKATFLGAHALPPEYKERRTDYIDLIVNDMLPIIKKEGLADYIDAFCESGYFTPEETTRIIKAGAEAGLKAKVHVNQFNSIGGLQACVDNGALSVDHLEVMTDEDLTALKKGTTLPVALPTCSFFLSIPYTPAREIIDAGLPLVLATDFNPGSTPSGNMQFVISLASIKMKMLPAEAFAAATINGAFAMEVENEVGSLEVGKRANVILTHPMDSLDYFPYNFGNTNINKVFINGELQKVD